MRNKQPISWTVGNDSITDGDDFTTYGIDKHIGDAVHHRNAVKVFSSESDRDKILTFLQGLNEYDREELVCPIYGESDLSQIPKGIYIGLFHGRSTEDEELEDWGFNGPVIGPLKFWQTTYQHDIRGEFDEKFKEFINKTYKQLGLCTDKAVSLEFRNNLVFIGEEFYGDYSVFYNDQGYPAHFFHI
jgi:hypothetical protein